MSREGYRTLSVTNAADENSKTNQISVTDQILDEYFSNTDNVKSQVNESFTAFMTVIILLNTIQIGAECQWHAEEDPILDIIYRVTDVFFLLCYMIEVIFKLWVLGSKGYFCGSAWLWNLFDFLLTGIMLIQITFDYAFKQTAGDEIGSIAKVARMIRLIRILRILKKIKHLTIVVGGLTKSIEALGWIVALLGLNIYCFGIFFTLTIKSETFPEGDYFVTLFKSMETLTDMVMGGTWGDIVFPITRSQPGILPFFFVFVIIATFGLLNLIVGVICDATSHTKDQLEWLTKREVLKTLSEVWLQKIRARGLGQDSLKGLQGQELEDKKQEKREAVQDILKEIIEDEIVEFPPGTNARDVFEMLDEEGRGELNHKDFTVGLGRILLGDQFQLSCLGIISAGRARRMTRNEQARKAVRDTAIEERLERIEQQLATGSNAAIQERLGKIEQQLATIVSKLDSKK